MKRITTDSKKVPDILGAGPLVKGRDPSVSRIRGAIYRVAKRLKAVLNPLHGMAQGTGFLDEKTLFNRFSAAEEQRYIFC